MKINRRAQIDRVIAVQGLSRADAADQLNTRMCEARRYLKSRARREEWPSVMDAAETPFAENH